MKDMITGLLEDQKTNRKEIRYLYDFLLYKNLDKEYHYFQENAHEVQDENLPFPRLTL